MYLILTSIIKLETDVSINLTVKACCNHRRQSTRNKEDAFPPSLC